MTTIDTSPDAAVADSGPEPGALAGSSLATLADWVITSDHKRIGRLFIGTSLIGLLGAAVLGVLLGIERADGTSLVFSASAIPEMFQAFRIGLVLAVLAPLGLGLAVAVVPLQLGARALAFPRVALAGFYAWLGGLVLVFVALANGGGIGGTDVDMVGLFLLGFALTALGLTATAGTVATTVLTTRAPGMSMRRVPVFSWASLVTSIGTLLALPVMVGTLIYVYIDVRYAADVFGGAAGIGVWLGWAFGQPTTFLFALPAIGVAAELVPVAFRRRQALRGVMFAGLALVGTAAFAGVTQQAIFNLPWSGSGLNFDDFDRKFRDLVPFALFNLVPLLGAVIVLALIALAAKPVKGDDNRPRVSAGLLFAFFGLGMVLVGMAGNVLYAIDDLALGGTVFEEGVLVYVAYGSVLGVLGAVAHWAPKLWGRRLPERALYLFVLTGLLGTILASLPYYVAGFADQPAAAAVFSYSGPETLWNVLVLAGHALMLLTVLGVVALAVSAFTGRGDEAGDDPWDAHTIEWTTASPAPPNNFPEVPVITSAEPLLDLKETAAPGTGTGDEGGAS